MKTAEFTDLSRHFRLKNRRGSRKRLYGSARRRFAVADTTQGAPNFRSTALQARYLWKDDIVGDQITLATGANVRFTNTASVYIDHFDGYGKIRQKSVDLGVRYGIRIGVWRTLRAEYTRRVLAKSCPQVANTFIFSYLLPFSF